MDRYKHDASLKRLDKGIYFHGNEHVKVTPISHSRHDLQ